MPAESVKVIVAVRVPSADGVKSIPTVQLDEGARLAPQVLLAMAKSPGFAPEKARSVIVIALAPLLVSVRDWGVLVDPAAVAEKVRLPGANTALVSEPVPDNPTVWGLFPAASVNVRVAARDPLALGVNVMLTVQVAEPARLVPQVLAEMAKSPGFAPDSATLLIAMAVAPPLVRVTDWAARVVPTVVAAKMRLVGETVALAADPIPDKVTV